MIDMEAYKRRVEEARAFLDNAVKGSPEVLIQLGTGLGGLVEGMDVERTIPYQQIPHFPTSTVTSHAGNLVFGRLADRDVAVLQGRLHLYEGYSALEVTFPIRVLSLLGIRSAIITNASGGLATSFRPGSIMVMRDHINQLGENPLRGPNVDEWGERFPDLSAPYDADLRLLAQQTAEKLGISEVCSGTYVCIPGPSLETPAETRFLKLIGADAVGMSSVPEVIVALHAGMRVLGLSVVANVNDPDNFQPILLDDIVQAAGEAEPRLQRLITAVVSEL